MIIRFKKALGRAKKAFFDQTFLYSKSVYECHRISFSQEGEDLLLKRLLPDIQKGFYIDIGSHHPQRLSNSYLFYLDGWRGINIDPLPNSKEKFDRIRPRDLNLQIGISNTNSILEYYMFNEPAYNTFNREVAELRPNPKGTLKLAVSTLESILEEHASTNQTIHFMSIDVEGHELEVLRSNNWQIYRPRIVLAEALHMSSLSQAASCGLTNFMEHIGYALYAKLHNTLFFIDQINHSN